MCWSTNDNNKIEIGPPGEPLALAVRNRLAWTHDKQDLNIRDHDVTIN